MTPPRPRSSIGRDRRSVIISTAITLTLTASILVARLTSDQGPTAPIAALKTSSPTSTSASASSAADTSAGLLRSHASVRVSMPNSACNRLAWASSAGAFMSSSIA